MSAGDPRWPWGYRVLKYPLQELCLQKTQHYGGSQSLHLENKSNFQSTAYWLRWLSGLQPTVWEARAELLLLLPHKRKRLFQSNEHSGRLQSRPSSKALPNKCPVQILFQCYLLSLPDKDPTREAKCPHRTLLKCNVEDQVWKPASQPASIMTLRNCLHLVSS